MSEEKPRQARNVSVKVHEHMGKAQKIADIALEMAVEEYPAAAETLIRREALSYLKIAYEALEKVCQYPSRKS